MSRAAILRPFTSSPFVVVSRSAHRPRDTGIMLFGRTVRTPEQRDALDVRRVREHVDRGAANELVAVLVAQHREIGRERRRVAGDVDDPRRRREPPVRRSALPASPARGGSTTTTSGAPARSASSSSDCPTLPAKNRAFVDAVRLRVLDRARDGLLGDLDAPHRRGVRGEREADRPGAAVEVVDRLGAGERGARRARARRASRPSRCSSAGRRSGARGSAARGAPPRSTPGPTGGASAGSSPRPGRSFTAQWIERTSGNRVSVSIRKSASNRSPGAVTSRTSSWPVFRASRTTRWRRYPVCVSWSYGSSPSERAHSSDRVADGVPEVRREQALVDVDRPRPTGPRGGTRARAPSSPAANEYSSLFR